MDESSCGCAVGCPLGCFDQLTVNASNKEKEHEDIKAKLKKKWLHGLRIPSKESAFRIDGRMSRKVIEGSFYRVVW